MAKIVFVIVTVTVHKRKSVTSQGIPQSHTMQHISHKKFIGKYTGGCFVQERSNKELARGRLY